MGPCAACGRGSRRVDARRSRRWPGRRALIGTVGASSRTVFGCAIIACAFRKEQRRRDSRRGKRSTRPCRCKPWKQEGRIHIEFDQNGASERLQILCEPLAYHLHALTNPAGVSVVHKKGASRTMCDSHSSRVAFLGLFPKSSATL